MENKPIQQRRNETIMPGYILHLSAAQMFLKTQKGQEFLKTKQDKNNFLIGNLLPDTTKIKARSHFRDPKYHDRMIEYPETSWFIKNISIFYQTAVWSDISFISTSIEDFSNTICQGS